MTLDVDGDSYEGDFEGIVSGWVYLDDEKHGHIAIPMEDLVCVGFNDDAEREAFQRATSSLTVTFPKN